MKKIYSLLLLAVMALGISFNASANVTDVKVKVNDTGIGVLYFYSFTSGDHTIDKAEYPLPADCGGEVVGTLYCPAGYSMTAVKQDGSDCTVDPYDGKQKIEINPGSFKNGDVINVTVTEGSGGGGGGEVEEQHITFIFSPAGSGYVVTAHADDGGNTVEDETYRPADGSDEVDVPYDPAGMYLIKPNSGYALLNAKDETQTTNPHYTGITPNLNDGFIHGQMTMIGAGSRVVVTATHSGSFTVKGVGEYIENISMTNETTSEAVTVTTDEQTVSFEGGTKYMIRSNSSAQLWKVEVTDAENYTTELEGNYGSFEYTPNDGDKVVIYSDKPIQYAKPYITFGGALTDASNIISKVMYDDNEIEDNAWEGENWNVVAGGYLRIFIDDSGFTNFTCTVNGTPSTLTSSYDGGKYFGVYLNNGSEILKDYNIVISAEKEEVYTVTFICETPSAVQIAPMVGYGTGTPFAFSTSGQSFKVSQSNNHIKFTPNNGWIIDGILVDGELPEAGEFTDNAYFVKSNCTITVNVTNKADLRTKTAVVYVDESVAKPTYLSLLFYGEHTSQTIAPGYNFVKFCDDDCPFTLGYYAGTSAEFYHNGEMVSGTMVSPEDGDVIKYFNGTPTQQVVTYNISDEVADLIEIHHDHTVSVDHQATQEYALFKGTIIHIKLKTLAEPAEARHRAASKAQLVVKVDGEAIQPDNEGVYTVKVGDTAPTIAVAKEVTTGVDDVIAEGSETFTVYNLQGIVVKANATADDLSTLPAGLYIANGSKVLVK